MENKDKRKITVWENGKQVKLYINKQETQDSIPTSDSPGKKQEAATVSDDEGEVPAYTRLTKIQAARFESLKQKVKKWKPVIIAILSALVIGSCLGIMMLKMFVTIEDSGQANGSASIPAVDNKDQEENESQGTATTIHGLQAFVLQGGVFSEKANAETWATNYKDNGIPTMTWEREGKYFLLIAAVASENEADQLNKSLAAADMDIYVKNWSTDSFEVNLTQSESDWIKSFTDIWKADLETEGFQTKTWQELLDKYPQEGNKLDGLKTEIETAISENEKGDYLQSRAVLLNLWYAYMSVAKNN
ncbi:MULTISPECIES: SPOR domain-containing protein [Virgibacillus]|uniref:SPOR domain-containing protein n=1 Tax=Virgibacillus kapii TaxID=1638645 RepID=A0ABQ2D8D6_9BACI|nr:MULTISPECIES: SPOR domain-containing protein [Virgibacillus]EQB35820.1 hypothetical protein M948_12335 [Virgibacillus sp. CM-4]GGJ49368.1 hypothetical protein GCM10007111_09390 [Virgibacillus kapii]